MDAEAPTAAGELLARGVSRRDATIVEAKAQGQSLAKIGEAVGLSKSAVFGVVKKHHQWVEERRREVVAAILEKFPAAVAAQFAIASNPEHRRSPDAFRAIADIAFPRTSGAGVQVNMAGRDLVNGPAQIANVPDGLAQKVFARPIKEINEEIAAMEAGFPLPTD